MSQDSQPPTPLRIAPKAAGRPAKAERPVSCWRTWPKAGRIWFDQESHPHYQIRRTIKGKAYQVSLPAGLTEVAAGVMLGRFLDDPDGFDPRGEARPDPIYLDAKLVKEFLTWAKLYGGKEGKGTSAAWRGIQRQHLASVMASMYRCGWNDSSGAVSNENTPAYLLALPRSVSMTAMRVPRPVAMARAEYVLPDPLGPTRARRRRDKVLLAFWNMVLLLGRVRAHERRRPRAHHERGPRSG